MASDAPLILAFDTSAAHCAAALVSGDRVLGSADEPMDRGQAERLLPLLEALLSEAGVSWGGLDGIAVVTGPGNFTGLRLAVAAARGLALGLGIPAVGVSRFEALACGQPGALVVTLRDRRGVLSQAFRDGVALGPAEAAADAAGASEARADLATVARLAARRLGSAPPPAPLYLRPAEATPAAAAVPLLLDDA